MLSLVMLVNRSGSMVIPFLGVYLTDHLGFDLKYSGMVLACFGVGALLGSWLGGFLTDKYGEFKVQVFSLFLSFPLFLLYPLLSTPITIGALVLLQSTVSEIFRPANSVAIKKYASEETLTRSFSLNRMAINLGFSVGPACAGLLSSISYNFLFIVNAITVLVAGIIYYKYFSQRHQVVQAPHLPTSSKPVSHPTAKNAYWDLKFWIYCIICTLFSICFFQIVNVVPLFYSQELHLDQTKIGLLMGLNGFIVVIFEMFIVNWAEQKTSLRQSMFLGTIICSLSYLLLGFEPGLFILALSTSILSIGEILVLPFMSTITALRAGDNNAGSYMGMNGMSISIAFIISPILGTKLAAEWSFSNLWIATAIVLLITAIAYFLFIPRLITTSKS